MNIVMDRIVVVTVTYNSSSYLYRLVESLEKQTIHIDLIVIVDNNSDEDNKRNICDIIGKYSNTVLVQLDDNTGGAGGFYEGTKYVLETEETFDWLWLMDDDAHPKSDCLENLLKNKDYTNVGCIMPMIFGDELKKYQFSHYKLFSGFLDREYKFSSNINDYSGIIEVESTAFVGPLIKKSVVEDVGYPDPELFIYGDDAEYTYRISRKYKIIVDSNAIIYHRDLFGKNGNIRRENAWKNYYMYRNKYLFIRRHKTNVIRGWIGVFLLTIRIQKNVLGLLIKNSEWKDKKIHVKYIYKGMLDGMKGIKGKTVVPGDL